MSKQSFRATLAAEFKNEGDPVILTYAAAFENYNLPEMGRWVAKVEEEALTLKGQSSAQLRTAEKCGEAALGVCDARARSATNTGPQWEALCGRIEVYLDRVERVLWP